MEGDWSGAGGGGGGMRQQAAPLADPDWRTRLPREKRQILVKRIMESLQKFTSLRDTGELHRLAELFEQHVFSTASSQDDYVWRISRKMLYLKGRHLPPAQAGGTSSQTSSGSVITAEVAAGESCTIFPQQQQQESSLQSTATQQGGISGVVWQRLQSLTASHLEDLKEIHIFLVLKSQQLQFLVPEQWERLKQYKDILYRIIPYLSVPRDKVPSQFTIEKVEQLERQINQILDTFKRRRGGLLPPTTTSSSSSSSIVID
ncbi:hypothetical protein CLOM_g20806 [Closterium sp. NIES-68]|nr:hypothetical protein CLOM_g20806 [Closterium sp. NIES-68]GJP81392.1 hypothetical protein CLOP_g11552 [Closterium sp. NIES-67]